MRNLARAILAIAAGLSCLIGTATNAQAAIAERLSLIHI